MIQGSIQFFHEPDTLSLSLNAFPLLLILVALTVILPARHCDFTLHGYFWAPLTLGILVKSVDKLKLMREGLRTLCDASLVPLIACKGLVEFGMHTL